MPDEHFFADQRFRRILEHARALRVRFPDEKEMRRLARLADVDSSVSDFSQNICSIIIDAHLNDASMRGRSTPEVKKTLSSVAKQATKLAATLREMDLKIAGGTGGSSQTAGTYLEWELSKFREALFPKYPDLLDVLHNAAASAEKAIVPKRGPKGAGGNPAFNLFIEQLWIAAFVRRGRWSVHKAVHGTWKGPILDALEVLKPYLPLHFFPPGELGRAVDHIVRKLRQRKHS